MFPRYSQLNTLIKSSNSTPSSGIKYLSQEELEGFFLCVKNPRDKALFGVIYLYGLRVSEATLLKLSHVDLERRTVLIQRVKGGIGGERPLFESAEKLLRRYLKVRLDTGDALFTGRQGNLKRGRIQQLFKGYAKKAGIHPRYSVHCLRHSIATHLLDAGEGIEFVRDHLGHRNIQNTMIYAQITNSKREEAFRRVERSSRIARI
jgi:integrase/recombinase XerD